MTIQLQSSYGGDPINVTLEIIKNSNLLNQLYDNNTSNNILTINVPYDILNLCVEFMRENKDTGLLKQPIPPLNMQESVIEFLTLYQFNFIKTNLVKSDNIYDIPKFTILLKMSDYLQINILKQLLLVVFAYYIGKKEICLNYVIPEKIIANVLSFKEIATNLEIDLDKIDFTKMIDYSVLHKINEEARNLNIEINSEEYFLKYGSQIKESQDKTYIKNRIDRKYEICLNGNNFEPSKECNKDPDRVKKMKENGDYIVNVETSEKDVETSEKDVETSEKDVETCEKNIEKSENDVETSEKDVETSEKDVETSEKDVETSEKDEE